MEAVLVAALQELYRTNEVARAFFDYARNRERGRSETPLERILDRLRDNGHEVSSSAMIAVFRELEELGCGRYVEGRHGHRSRFAWTESIVAVGQAAAGELAAADEAADIAPLPDTLNHSYHLRPDFQARIELPTDLTVREAERLAAFIGTLAMDEEE